MKVCIDPGHGQYENKGVLGYYEGTQMWKLGQYIQSEFEKHGWEVINTRPKITDNPELEWRGQQAKGCDLFISLHSNAPGPGVENYSEIRGVAIFDSVADRLDYIEVPLCAEIARLMNTPNRGVQHRWNTRKDRQGQDYYGVLRNATTVAGCPDAMLIEFGFHTNQADAAWLLQEQNLRMLAVAVVDLIDTLWRKQHNLPTEEDNMIFCAQGQGSTSKPDPNVKVMQQGFLALGISMINNGVAYYADGSYGTATVNGCKIFEKQAGINGDGTQFTDKHVAKLIEMLCKKIEAMPTITQAQLDAEIAKTKAAETKLKAAEAKLQSVHAAINTLKTF